MAETMTAPRSGGFGQNTPTHLGNAVAAGKKGKAASPWSRYSMCSGEKAKQTFDAHKGKRK